MPDQNKILTEHSINYFLIGPFGNVITNKTWGDLFLIPNPNGVIVNTVHIPNVSTWLEQDYSAGRDFFQQATILG